MPDHHLLTRYRQQAALQTILRHAAAQTSPTDLPVTASPGDLRGIPIIGKGVGGAIPHTAPHHSPLLHHDH